MLTALLGAVIFSESLPGLWWLGAALLITGSVIIGRREEGAKEGDAGTAGAEGGLLTGQVDDASDTPEEAFADEPDLGDLGENGVKTSLELRDIQEEGSSTT